MPVDKVMRTFLTACANEHHGGPTKDELRSVLKWPTLQSRRGYQKYLQVYKCLNGQAPSYLLDVFEKCRKYNTRNKDLLCLPRARTSKFQSSFKFNAAKKWNWLPPRIRRSQSILSFKRHAKQHFSEPTVPINKVVFATQMFCTLALVLASFHFVYHFHFICWFIWSLWKICLSCFCYTELHLNQHSWTGLSVC